MPSVSLLPLAFSSCHREVFSIMQLLPDIAKQAGHLKDCLEEVFFTCWSQDRMEERKADF